MLTLAMTAQARAGARLHGRGALAFAGALAAALALTGCAKHFEDVQPADIPASEYAHHDCDELDAALATAMRRSDAATMEQAELYGADIGLTASAVFAPWSLFFLGDEGNEIDLAEYKGQVLALQRARQARCF